MPNEINYSTTEKEALAVVWAVEHFRGYLDGAEAVIATDHQPLKWLLSLKSPTGRLARWELRLQPFNIKMTYIPGKTNVLADTLSRPPCEHSEECTVCSIQVDLPHSGADEVRNKQLGDEELKTIITAFESTSDDDNFQRFSQRGYFMNNGILYKYAGDSEDPVLVIPKDERNAILLAYHDEPTAGHYGIERTTARISTRYFWPHMRSDIAKYIAGCLECQRYKASNLKPAGLFKQQQ